MPQPCARVSPSTPVLRRLTRRLCSSMRSGWSGHGAKLFSERLIMLQNGRRRKGRTNGSEYCGYELTEAEASRELPVVDE